MVIHSPSSSSANFFEQLAHGFQQLKRAAVGGVNVAEAVVGRPAVEAKNNGFGTGLHGCSERGKWSGWQDLSTKNKPTGQKAHAGPAYPKNVFCRIAPITTAYQRPHFRLPGPWSSSFYMSNASASVPAPRAKNALLTSLLKPRNPVSQQPAPSPAWAPCPTPAGTTFRVWAPHAEAVAVIGTFNDWEGDTTPAPARRQWLLGHRRARRQARRRVQVPPHQRQANSTATTPTPGR